MAWESTDTVSALFCIAILAPIGIAVLDKIVWKIKEKLKWGY